MELYLLVIQRQLLLRSTIDLDLLVSEIRERSQERKGNATRQEEEEEKNHPSRLFADRHLSFYFLLE